ncbi:MAG: hypothetical protein H0T62_07735 [Parachlamydiaceae bacterium]|nr:hypothetical protein [Parachlamydiaceae bacterium]
MKYIVILIACLISSIYGEDLNRLTYFQINSDKDIHWISLEVKRFHLSYDHSGNPEIENRGIHSFKLFSPYVDVCNFTLPENINVNILKESSFKNNFNESFFELDINGHKYLAIGDPIDPPLPKYWDDPFSHIQNRKDFTDYRKGNTTTQFLWKDHSFTAFDVGNIKNGMMLELMDEMIRPWGTNNSIFTFSRPDQTQFTAVGARVNPRWNYTNEYDQDQVLVVAKMEKRPFGQPTIYYLSGSQNRNGEFTNAPSILYAKNLDSYFPFDDYLGEGEHLIHSNGKLINLERNISYSIHEGFLSKD